jgi:hypothetical protein
MLGCSASFLEAADPNEIAKYSEFINDCQKAIVGEFFEGVLCSSDADCYSQRCNKTIGRCIQGDAEVLDVYTPLHSLTHSLTHSHFQVTQSFQLN